MIAIPVRTILFLLLALPAAVHAEVVISAACDKPEYVSREPITLWVSLRNAGSETVQIMAPHRLGMNMQFMHYEVTEPDGVTVLRKHSYLTRIGVVNTLYPGEPLGPDESVEVTLNPTLSRSLPGEEPRVGFTFREPGTYRLRVVYSLPNHYVLLWRPPNGVPLFSNTVIINVRAATTVENEILDAYWTDSSVGTIAGDDEIPVEVDILRIEAVLDQYESQPLADYLRFNLARGLLSASIGDPEAVKLLEELRAKEFKSCEVHSILAVAYALQGRKAEAMQVLFDGARQRPMLLTNENFVRRMVFAYYGSDARVDEWEEQCVRGQRRNLGGVTVPSELLEAVPHD